MRKPNKGTKTQQLKHICEVYEPVSTHLYGKVRWSEGIRQRERKADSGRSTQLLGAVHNYRPSTDRHKVPKELPSHPCFLFEKESDLVSEDKSESSNNSIIETTEPVAEVVQEIEKEEKATTQKEDAPIVKKESVVIPQLSGAPLALHAHHEHSLPRSFRLEADLPRIVFGGRLTYRVQIRRGSHGGCIAAQLEVSTRWWFWFHG